MRFTTTESKILPSLYRSLLPCLPDPKFLVREIVRRSNEVALGQESEELVRGAERPERHEERREVVSINCRYIESVCASKMRLSKTYLDPRDSLPQR